MDHAVSLNAFIMLVLVASAGYLVYLFSPHGRFCSWDLRW
jgi:hypothetical protein